jgi:4-alpha-glucanotransferase
MCALTREEEYGRRILDLALRKGIDPEYRDIWGQTHAVPLATQEKILKALGTALEEAEAPSGDDAGEEWKEWKNLTDPLLILSVEGLPEELVFQFPVPRLPEEKSLPPEVEVELLIRLEKGQAERHVFAGPQLRFIETKEIEGRRVLRAGLPFPRDWPLGYHRAVLSVTDALTRREQPLHIIICPSRAYLPTALTGKGKRAGITIALSGLHSAQSWGVGDLGDLRAFVRWANENLGVDAIGLLPLHALANKEPYNISPYYPSSRFYRNPLYLNVPEIEEYELLPGEGEEKLPPEDRELLKELRHSERVRFEAAARLKDRVLRKMFEKFLERHWKAAGQESRRQKQFAFYIHQEGKLLDLFALFCALQEHFQGMDPEMHTFAQWPAPFQDPQSLEVRFFQALHWERVLYYKYLQWQMQVQLEAVQAQTRKSGASIGLYHDLALGIDPWGADAWAWRDFFVPGFRVGAPPDEYSPKGQEWGFYPPNGQRNREDGYRFFSWEIRKNSRPGGALRIDHILQFARLFWIPEGESPREGAYVKYDLEAALKILALESMRNKTLLIGEDLGTVPDHLREGLSRFGIFSYRLFYFEKGEGGLLKKPADYPEAALSAVSTHDLPPLKGFWGMNDIRLRKDLGLFPEEAHFHQAMLQRLLDKRQMVASLEQNGFLSREEALALQAQDQPVLTGELQRAVWAYLLTTPSKLAVISQEDLWGIGEQFNLPGTTTAYPNWSGKMPFSLEEMWNHPEVRKRVEPFRELLKRSERGLDRS